MLGMNFIILQKKLQKKEEIKKMRVRKKTGKWKKPKPKKQKKKPRKVHEPKSGRFNMKLPLMDQNLTIRQFYCLMQPRKKQIIKLIEQAGKPMYINEIAKYMKINHRTVSFHLTDLENFGFLKSKFEINPDGRGSRFYNITKKIYSTKQKIIEESV